MPWIKLILYIFHKTFFMGLGGDSPVTVQLELFAYQIFSANLHESQYEERPSMEKIQATSH